MPGPKTKLNDLSVSGFLNKIPNQQLREDCLAVVDIMESATRAEARMWGSAIIGFGEHMVQYAGGREAKWMLIGFSPRKQNITLYIGSSFPEHDALLEELGPHSTGKGCLYIARLSDVHVPTLKKLVNASVKHKVASAKSGPSAPSAAKLKVARTRSGPKSGKPAKTKAKSRTKSRKV
jgi:Domain of unknown function (DU1801)